MNRLFTKRTVDWVLLLVCENRLTITFLEYALGKLGYDFILVGTGEEAVDLARTRWIDAVLIDIELGNLGIGMSDVQTLRRIREIEHLKDVPVIAISDYPTKSDAGWMSEAGYNGFLTRPFDSRQLNRVLNRNLTDRWQARIRHEEVSPGDDRMHSPVV